MNNVKIYFIHRSDFVNSLIGIMIDNLLLTDNQETLISLLYTSVISCNSVSEDRVACDG